MINEKIHSVSQNSPASCHVLRTVLCMRRDKKWALIKRSFSLEKEEEK